MIKLAFYGKGGIGKSTTVSNMAVAFAQMGYKVMQIGCDPKADSTMNLREGKEKQAVLDILREKNKEATLDDVITQGYAGVYLVEAGGPIPGLGCAGRGIIAAMEFLDEKKAYDIYQPDIVLFDVLGDVVCGGFSMPIREGYATLGGVIVNKRNVKKEEERIEQLCEDIHSQVISTLEYDPLIQEADEMHKTVLEAFPQSDAADRYRHLAQVLLESNQNE